MIGVHLNLLPGGGATAEPRPEELAALSPAEQERTLASWERYRNWARERQGYADIQATRPQTLAYGLNDSPVGLLAWIAEKFTEWSDPACPVNRDQMLTNVMLYWLTGTAGSAARIYYERAHAAYAGRPPEVSRTPTALADFPGTTSSRCATSPRAPTPSCAGPRTTGAATSPPWRCPSCWWGTSAPSSGNCAVCSPGHAVRSRPGRGRLLATWVDYFC